MSYILDALKKADSERALGDVPDLETAHWGERHSRRSYRWVWVVVFLLVANGALLAYLLGRDDQAVESQKVASTTHEEKMAPVLPRPEPAAVSPSEKITQPREPVYVPPAPVKRPLPSVQYMPVPEETPAYTEPSAYITPPPVPVTTNGVPYWNDLPLEFRSGLILPHIDVHVYAEDPARRFILVDLEKYREGETLESGVVVEMINETNIQLNYRGTRFLMER